MRRIGALALLLVGAVAMPSALGAGTKAAEKAAFKCARCRDTGRVPCLVHSRGGPRYKAFCSADPEPACCKGVGWTPCPKCADEATKKRFEEIAATYERERKGEGFFPWGEKLLCAACEHFRFKAAATHSECHEFHAVAEKAFSLFQRIFGEEGVDQLSWDRKAHFLILPSRDQYHQFLDWYKTHRNVNPNQIDFLKGGDGARLISDRLQAIVRGLSGGGKEDKEMILHKIAHAAGHLAIENYKTHGNTPDWLGEGFAGRSEIEALKEPRIYCIQYVAGGPGQRAPHEWRKTVRDAIVRRTIPSFPKLFEKKVGEMSVVDWSMSVSVVTWLAETQPRKMVKLMDEIKKGKDSREALEAALEKPVAEIEKDWQKWARTH